ncbi:hypothetical protein BpHYR1_015959 [Brachionus plicatilis]|uniref:Uncharacterized protein n=1 Tax=Brachionus plicatilis TaxID=10195 RepID=A0A3M7PLU6_BRAPC|nr:hypothetical protein BpHYR1_015959 [Brachionus plicatilis]
MRNQISSQSFHLSMVPVPI